MRRCCLCARSMGELQQNKTETEQMLGVAQALRQIDDTPDPTTDHYQAQ